MSEPNLFDKEFREFCKGATQDHAHLELQIQYAQMRNLQLIAEQLCKLNGVLGTLSARGRGY
jgi:hypothetical protein